MAETIIYVVGTHGTAPLPEHVNSLLSRCGVVVGPLTLLDHLKETDCGASHIHRWVPITPLTSCLKSIKEESQHHSIMVFTSGDPLFYGFGRALTEKLPRRNIVFLPTLSSMQLCFARVGLPWDDASFLSLHGRDLSEIDTVLTKKKLFILTDRSNSPATIASYLLTKLPRSVSSKLEMHVGVRLGLEGERMVSRSLPEMVHLHFEQPNCVILHDKEEEHQVFPSSFGLGEEDIAHSRGLITKNEVRAAVVHALKIPQKGVFWDIGAGSGSISIEVSRLYPQVLVFSVEKKEQERENISCNRERFSCWNQTIVAGEAPESLYDLPTPDRVFIGGSSGKMRTIIDYIVAVNPTCPIVITAVIESTIERVPKMLHDLGFDVEISEITTRRYRYPQPEVRTFNPIHIIKGHPRRS